MTKSKSNELSFKTQMLKSSASVLNSLKQEQLNSRFYVGSQNRYRLRKSLESVGRLDLLESTLLSPEVHRIHSQRLAERYLKKWMRVRSVCHNTDQARSRFRFLTLLDCLVVLDPNLSTKTISAFKEALAGVLRESTGIWMLGAVEVEVVSLEMMRKNRELITTESGEMRKLDVCEGLLARLPKRDRHLPCYFLIHFHGLVSAVSEVRFNQFEQNLRSVKRWRSIPRGIELKRLSLSFRGKSKSMESNLRDIARYITKGGNDWVGEKTYLRYKLSLEGRSDEDAWVQKEWRSNELLKRERNEEGVDDILSLTHFEIACLADVINQMMNLKRNKTGYLVSS